MNGWSVASSVMLVVLLVSPLGCSGDDSTDDSGNEDGPADTTATSTSAGSGSASNASTTGNDSTTGTPMGTMVGSCDECSADELCMILTEFSGPGDGGPPPMTPFCFPFPAACGDTVDCMCAGHLCPSEGGAEGTCSVMDEILRCAVAYP